MVHSQKLDRKVLPLFIALKNLSGKIVNGFLIEIILVYMKVQLIYMNYIWVLGKQKEKKFF